MRVLTSITVIMTLLAWVPPSVAANPATPDGDELAKQSRRAYVVGNLEEAIKGFENAYQVSGDASLLFDLAEAQREAGHPNDALTSYQNYLRRAPAGIYRRSAERQIRELKKTRSVSSGARSAATPPAPKDGTSAPGPSAPSAPRASSAVPAAPAAVAPMAPPAAAPRRPVQPSSSVTESPTPPGVPPPGGDYVSRPAAPPPPRPLLTLPESDAVIRPLPSSEVRPLPAPSAVKLNPSGEAPDPGVPTTRVQVDLVRSPTEPAPSSPTVARWVPIALGVITIGLGTAAVFAGLSASHRYDDLQATCGATPAGCMSPAIDEVRSRANRANFLWAATGLAGIGFGTTLYLNLRDTGPTGQQVSGL